MIQFLHDVDLIIEQVDVSNVHFFEFNDLDSIPLLFDVILDPFVNLATVSTTNDITKIKTVPSDSLLSSVHGLYLLSITLLHVN